MPAQRRMSYSDLLRINAALRQRIEELEHPPAPKIALKLAAYNAHINPERLRRWCLNKKVDAELVGHQWFVNESDLARRMQCLTGSVPHSRRYKD
jgi:hypothetical protein